MKTIYKEVWEFFASVKLALFTFIVLALTSIIGTVIPQGEPLQFYSQKFGPTAARLFALFDIPNMYHSFWFLSFLVLFCINLVVCSLKRLPRVWRQVRQDNLAVDRARLEKMKPRQVFFSDLSSQEAGVAMEKELADNGWQPRKRILPDGKLLFFAHKGAWSRFGVYVVHLSILFIFAGAIIGAVTGFKASIMLPEGSTTRMVYQSNAEHTPLDIGFELRCDRFGIDYYPNGMTREYWSDLVVLENGKEILRKTIEVNDPLKYRGLTFYQSSYQALDNQYLATVSRKDAAGQRFFVQPRKQVVWRDEGVRFGIINQAPGWQGKPSRYKIWFSDGKDRPVRFWAEDNRKVVVSQSGVDYQFVIKQEFATGLQVAKDPGVWWVYVGCILMLGGLVVVFLLSHRRLWLLVHEEHGRTRVLVSGVANKNRIGFEKSFGRIADALARRLDQETKGDPR